MTALGWFQSGSGTWQSTHPFGIYAVTVDDSVHTWDGDGWYADITSATLPASATVSSSDPLVGDFRYTSIPALYLPVGQEYAILGVNGSDPYNIGNAVFTVNPLITFAGGAAETADIWNNNETDLTPPGKAYDLESTYWVAPNYMEQSAAVPEPCSAALMAAGLGLAARRIRRRRAN